MSSPLTLTFLGDLMLGRGVSRKLRDHPPAWFWGDTLPILLKADAVIANLESPITTSEERWRQTWKMFHFKASPEAVGILRAGNVGLVCLANNHILDFGTRGLLDTLDVLDRAGIRHAGAGLNATHASAPLVFDLPGLKIGLIAATDNMPEFAAGSDRPGTNYVVFRDEPDDLRWVERSVSDLRGAGASLTILSVHWGPNMRIRPSREFRRFAHAAIERGVDIIHGHSAHVVQAIERHGRGVILYDVGNFMDDYWKFPFRRTIWSFIFNLDVENGQPRRLRLVPVLIHSSPLGIATGEIFDGITRNMKSLCAAFETTTINTDEGLEIPLN